MLHYQSSSLNIENRSSMSRPAKYIPGDLVFAKVKGYPPWPARVTSVKSSRYKIFFYGTLETATLKREDIWPYNQENEDKFAPKNLKRKWYSEGLDQIKNSPEIALVECDGIAVSKDRSFTTSSMDAIYASMVFQENSKQKATPAVASKTNSVTVPVHKSTPKYAPVKKSMPTTALETKNTPMFSTASENKIFAAENEMIIAENKILKCEMAKNEENMRDLQEENEILKKIIYKDYIDLGKLKQKSEDELTEQKELVNHLAASIKQYTAENEILRSEIQKKENCMKMVKRVVERKRRREEDHRIVDDKDQEIASSFCQPLIGDSDLDSKQLTSDLLHKSKKMKLDIVNDSSSGSDSEGLYISR